MFYIAFAVLCIFDIYFLGSTIRVSFPEKSSLMDVMVYSFNTYSNVLLCYLPLFLIMEIAFFNHGKFNEFVLVRYNSRLKYLWKKELAGVKFCFFYRIIETITAFFVYVIFCFVTGADFAFISSLSKNMQQFMCLSEIGEGETLIIFCFTFFSLLFLELIFSQIVIITSETNIPSIVSTAIAIGADLLLLVWIKCYFWFSGLQISQIFPYNNLFLQFIYRESYISREASSVTDLIFPIIYCGLAIMTLFVVSYLYISQKDFLYETTANKI